MIRINVLTEGASELCFVKNILNNHFSGSRILDARSVMTSKNNKLNYEYRGGVLKYDQVKRDLLKWLVEDTGAYVTTMLDFFRLPNDFPDYGAAMAYSDHKKSVKVLEDGLKRDICRALPGVLPQRFIPYIQLHEFEALFYTDIRALEYDYLEDADRIRELYNATKDIPPEEINHGADTAPSKRLLKILPYQKGDASCAVLESITVTAMLAKCPHFAQWIQQMHALPELSI